MLYRNFGLSLCDTEYIFFLLLPCVLLKSRRRQFQCACFDFPYIRGGIRPMVSPYSFCKASGYGPAHSLHPCMPGLTCPGHQPALLLFRVILAVSHPTETLGSVKCSAPASESGWYRSQSSAPCHGPGVFK